MTITRSTAAALLAIGSIAIGAPAGAEVIGVAGDGEEGWTVVEGDYTVPEGARIEGSLRVIGGTATIHGWVDGRVCQEGPGDLIIGKTGSAFDGVKESGPGSVRVSGYTFSALEYDEGSVIVHSSGEARTVVERNAGDAVVHGVTTAVWETGKGDVKVRRTARVGSVWEHNTGNAVVYRGAKVEGWAFESGKGKKVSRNSSAPAAHTNAASPTEDTAEGCADLKVVKGDYTVPRGTVVEGDLKVVGGTVTVDGTVDGTVRQAGKGDLVIGETGVVLGAWESGAGSVHIYGYVGWNIREVADGGVVIHRSGSVGNYIGELQDGGIVVRGTVGGAMFEGRVGSIELRRTAKVVGEVYERNQGDIVVYRGAKTKGEVLEHGKGKLVRR